MNIESIFDQALDYFIKYLNYINVDVFGKVIHSFKSGEKYISKCGLFPYFIVY